MHTFSTVKEVADYLSDKAVGTACVLTGGGKSTASLRSRFMRYGIRVKFEGVLGARTVELTQAFSQDLKDRKRESQDRYWARDLSPGTIQYPEGLAVGASAIVKAASGKALRSWVTQHYGPWTCAVRKSNVAGDWEVTRLSATKDRTKFTT